MKIMAMSARRDELYLATGVTAMAQARDGASTNTKMMNHGQRLSTAMILDGQHAVTEFDCGSAKNVTQ